MNSAPVMAGVRMTNTKYLLETVSSSETQLGSVISDIYSRHALAFPETLSFLTSLGVLQRANERILHGMYFATAMDRLAQGPTEYTRFLLELAVKSPSEHGRELRRILLDFSPTESMLSISPLGAKDPKYAARDMLVSSDVVLLDHETGAATLRPAYHGLYGLALSYAGMRPEKIVELEARNRDLGYCAERMVLDYERKAVGSRYASQVVHVSRLSASAGFDIASFRVRASSLAESRLIEVKAVNREDFGFFMSAEEVEVARCSEDTYFLYLVPIRNGRPAREELLIIKNPAQHLLDASSDWEVKASGYHCKKRLKS